MSGATRINKRNKLGGSFVAFPHAVLNCPNFALLSAKATKLICDMASQYKGNNNGDLSASWSIMKKKGWRSRETLANALKELRYYELVTQTRQGGIFVGCSLYALTWQPIDECGGKLEVNATKIASGLWRIEKPPLDEVPSTE